MEEAVRVGATAVERLRGEEPRALGAVGGLRVGDRHEPRREPRVEGRDVRGDLVGERRPVVGPLELDPDRRLLRRRREPPADRIPAERRDHVRLDVDDDARRARRRPFGGLRLANTPAMERDPQVAPGVTTASRMFASPRRAGRRR